MAGSRYTLQQLQTLFEKQENLLGRGQQGVVVRSDDGRHAIKRQSLIPSEEEMQHDVTPASSAYVAARVGDEGLGPKVFQYEEDPIADTSYMVMENLNTAGYQPLATIIDQQGLYKRLYGQQQLLEAQAARAGIHLRDTQNANNVFYHPETGEMKFIDQGFAKPYESVAQRNLGQALAGMSGLRNLEDEGAVQMIESRLAGSRGRPDREALLESLAADAVAALQQGLAGARGPNSLLTPPPAP